jgi:penicillin-binding protein
LIATEDENFEHHKGVVPKAFFRAILGESMGGSSSGGSTITQQLIKQQVLGDSPTFKRKATEMVYALELEKHFTNDEILTDYLNVSPFGRNNKGQNIAGVEEAAKGIFGKSAKDLTIPEQLLSQVYHRVLLFIHLMVQMAILNLRKICNMA